MAGLQVTFLGSGDAFGSGGRFQTCILLRKAAPEIPPGPGVLLDCGASSLVAMRRAGVAPNSIGTILLSHLHGDHFGGLPFFILDAQLVSKRTEPLRIAGPPGSGRRISEALEVFFPGSSTVERKFAVDITELTPGIPFVLGDLEVTGHGVRHPSGAPPLALRVTWGGRTVAYTGDTEWCEGIVAAGQGADLLIAEGYRLERPVKFHLDLPTLRAHRGELAAGRIVLTHMSEEVLAHAADLEFECAEDGLTLEV